MTPNQVLAVAAIGGLTALLLVALAVALALGLHQLVQRVIDIHEEHQERRRQRRDLTTCRAIDALPHATHPKEEPR